MTKTISTDETIILLALVVAFVAGAAVFGYISDSEAEAKPKKKCPPACIDPILKPMNFSIIKVAIYNHQLDKIDSRLAEILEGIGTSPGTDDDKVNLLVELDEIEITANSIILTAIDAKDILTDDTPPAAPTLLTPVDDAVICRGDSDTILFEWSEVVDESGIAKYELRVLDGETQVVYNINTNDNDDNGLDVADLSDGIHFWNVKATDGAGNEGQFAAASFSLSIVTVC